MALLEELLSGTEDVPKRDKFTTTIPVSQPTWYDLLNYVTADTHKLEKRPWSAFIGSFSMISER
jgi:hypothetical protein